MALEFAALDPKELILVVLAVFGLAPVLLSSSSRSKLFTGGYLLLCVGAVATNLEALFLGDVLNGVEHVVGIAGSGVVFFVAAYTRRRQASEEGE